MGFWSQQVPFRESLKKSYLVFQNQSFQLTHAKWMWQRWRISYTLLWTFWSSMQTQTFGSPISAMATDSLRFWPPLSLDAITSAWSSRSTLFIALITWCTKQWKITLCLRIHQWNDRWCGSDHFPLKAKQNHSTSLSYLEQLHCISLCGKKCICQIFWCKIVATMSSKRGRGGGGD